MAAQFLQQLSRWKYDLSYALLAFMSISLPENIIELVNSRKSLIARPKWDERSDPRYLVFTAPLAVNHVITGGFELRAKVSKQHVGRDALMQLEFAKSGRERIELARCQWRPFETHTNKHWGPPGHELCTYLEQSHHHAFEHNYLAEERRMRTGSLPAALPIHPDPTTLSAFIAFCGECFKINNIRVVEVPGVTTDLFW